MSKRGRTVAWWQQDVKCYPQVMEQPSYGCSSCPVAKSCGLMKKSWKWCSRSPKAANTPWKKQELFSHIYGFSQQNLLLCGDLSCCPGSQVTAVPKLWISGWWEDGQGKHCCCSPSYYTLPTAAAGDRWQIGPDLSSDLALLFFISWVVTFMFTSLCCFLVD